MMGQGLDDDIVLFFVDTKLGRIIFIEHVQGTFVPSRCILVYMGRL